MSNPILKDCIKALSNSVNPSKSIAHAGITHPVDESKAKELFKALREQGVPLIETEVLALAISNNWSEKHAKALAKLAQKIGDGGRVVIKRPLNWGVTTLEKINLHQHK